MVISRAVRWDFRSAQLCLRDIEELLFKRGVVVSYVDRGWSMESTLELRGDPAILRRGRRARVRTRRPFAIVCRWRLHYDRGGPVRRRYRYGHAFCGRENPPPPENFVASRCAACPTRSIRSTTAWIVLSRSTSRIDMVIVAAGVAIAVPRIQELDRGDHATVLFGPNATLLFGAYTKKITQC